jgi:hypothetical protein
MESLTSGTEQSKQVISALVNAAKAMPSLVKGARNEHGGYNYVSIDSMYENIAQVALGFGLTWKAREVSFDVMPDFGKYGTIVTGYAFDLMHEETGTIWTDFFACSIAHPPQGAQTAGSALSYADKLFMRTVFKVQTGEKDADATDGSEMTHKPATDMFAPAPVVGQVLGKALPIVGHLSNADDPKPVSRDGYGQDQANAFLAMLRVFIPDAKTSDELKQFWNGNITELEALKSWSPKDRAEADAMFKARNQALKKEGK